MRIFLGINEVANITNIYTKAFRALGHSTLTAIVQKNSFYPDSNYDVVFKSSRRDINYHVRYVRWAKIFIEALITCDVFIFTYGSMLPNWWDVFLLKRLGKKLVFVFWGSEIRYMDFFEFQMREMGVLHEYKYFIQGIREQKEEPLTSKWKRVNMAERFGDLILSQPGYGQLQTRPYMRANIPLILERYRHVVWGRECPVIVHAPSNPLIKGSDFIQEIINELHEEGLSFEFHLIQNTSNTELLDILSDADIVIDQLYGDAIGMFSHEAMASGNLVLSHYPTTFSKIPADCPVVNITRENLREQLRRAVVDINWRVELSHQGRVFVEKYCNHIHVAKQILDWLKPDGISQYDFMPAEINSAGLRQFINNKINTQ